jgi:hypothetical protein
MGPPWSLLVRASTLEASWVPARMQGLGFARTLLRLRAGREASGLAPHAAGFGCNLWTMPAILGAVARLEREDLGPEALALRDRLAGPLSAAGDLHVWRAVRPAALLLGVLGTLLGQPALGLALGISAYDAALVRTWWSGFRVGWVQGARLEEAFAAARPDPRVGRALRRALGLFGGGLAGWGLLTAAQAAPSSAFLMSAVLVVGYHAAPRRASVGLAFLGWVLLASLLQRFSSPVGLP